MSGFEMSGFEMSGFEMSGLSRTDPREAAGERTRRAGLLDLDDAHVDLRVRVRRGDVERARGQRHAAAS